MYRHDGEKRKKEGGVNQLDFSIYVCVYMTKRKKREISKRMVLINFFGECMCVTK